MMKPYGDKVGLGVAVLPFGFLALAPRFVGLRFTSTLP
jgi:hypothetical protein